MRNKARSASNGASLVTLVSPFGQRMLPSQRRPLAVAIAPGLRLVPRRCYLERATGSESSCMVVGAIGAQGVYARGGPSTTGFALRSGRAELTPQQDVDGADAAVVALRTGKREHMAADPASRQPDLKT